MPAGAGQTVVLDFDGMQIPARIGESVAAALTRNNVRHLRQALDGSARGIFCGMGVCQDCVLEIDGAPLRACMTKVTGPHRLALGGLARAVGGLSTATIVIEDIPVETPDVLVIGGGAAGLSAATAAAQAGASVDLIDERARLGGQYFKQPADTRATADDAQFAGGRELIERARQAGVRVQSDATVWAAVPNREIAVSSPRGLTLFRPAALVVATGAYERALPLPGWTLPGVMTTGAVQTLLRGEGVATGPRVLVCGHGPLNLQVAVELARRGAHVLAVAELARPPAPRHVGALLVMTTSTPGLLLRGAALRAALHQRGIQILNSRVLRAVRQGTSGLVAELATLPGLDTTESFETDIVCMGYGFQPANEILRSLDCRHHFDEARGHLITERNDDCATSVAGVFAAGDCCGLAGAPVAMEEGLIAGAAAASQAGHAPPQALKQGVAAARRRVARHRRFQDGLWRLYAAPRLDAQLATPATPICRCELATLGAIQGVIEDGHASIAEIKRRTRAGMGACQGRYCAPVIATLLAHHTGTPIDEYATFAPRAPIKPIAIAELSRPAPPV
jgi:NADPH-dependent 2,4-dienoyl-CoA reductase/sulfur reductase-like enzyme